MSGFFLILMGFFIVVAMLATGIKSEQHKSLTLWGPEKRL